MDVRAEMGSKIQTRVEASGGLPGGLPRFFGTLSSAGNAMMHSIQPTAMRLELLRDRDLVCSKGALHVANFV
jgi:hypothetical protein